MASNLSCSLLVLGKLSHGVMSSWMRCRRKNRVQRGSKWSDFKQKVESYLFECPLAGADLVHHPKRDADHGGESQKPANDIAPPRVHILIVVLQRSVFNEGEGKGALKSQAHKYYYR